MIKRRPDYNLALLKIPQRAEKFSKQLQIRRPNIRLIGLSDRDLSNDWDRFVEDLHLEAKKELSKPFQRSASQISSRQTFFKFLKRLQHPRVIDQNSIYNSISDRPPRRDPDLLAQVKARRCQYLQETRDITRKKILVALESVESTSHPSTRLNQTFRLIRYLKRNPIKKGQPAVSMNTLISELKSLDKGPIPLLPETDHFPVTPPPSRGDLQILIGKMNNGVAPGPDQIFNELFLAEHVFVEIATFIKHCYILNQVPMQWKETSIFLLPKIVKPKNFDDFRPITLCSAAYKIYAQYLLDELKSYLAPIPEYQSGFLNNRSCDDAIFTLNRALETNWNHSIPMYVLTLDIKKAFSTVNVHHLPKILLQRGAPAFLINRISEACLQENTRIDYMGQQTAKYPKTREIKQGCPISPFLFVVLMDHLLHEVQDKLQQHHQIKIFMGEPNGKISYPALFSYADDMTVLSPSLDILDPLVHIMSETLQKYGMELNANKCELLLKSPVMALHAALGESVELGGSLINVKQKVTILGSQLNHGMNRRQMIQDRLGKAQGVFYALLSVLKEQKLAFDVLVRIYSSMIVPVMLYGLRSVSFTLANKRMIMHREVQMLRSLAGIANPSPKNESLIKILRGRTINRVLTAGRIMYFSHIHRTPSGSLLKRALHYKINKRRKVGRPLYTYNRFMTKEFKAVSHLVNSREWAEAYDNSSDTKKLCQKLYHLNNDPCDPMTTNVYIQPAADTSRSVIISRQFQS